MAAINEVDDQMVCDIRQAVKDCTARGLVVASKWSSELLLSLTPAKRRLQKERSPKADVSMFLHSSMHSSTPARARSPRPSLSFTALSPHPSAHASTPAHPSQKKQNAHDTMITTDKTEEAALEAEEEDFIDAAKSLLDIKEYGRAHKLLRNCQSMKARFICLYSQYLAGERKAMQDWHALDGSRSQPPKPVNDVLAEMVEALQHATDPWLLFLKGLVLSRVGRREESIEAAILSIAGYPWNWSTWVMLMSCIKDGEELASLVPLIPLPPTHPLVQIFQAKCMCELHYPNQSEAAYCERLLGQEFFPNSLWIMSLRATILFILHEHADAEAQFIQILSIDPERIDNIDIYSNILYLTDNKLKLSSLAHDFLALDKDRPEVCCVVGNHYSIRAEHEKAIKYFRRATHLDRTYLAAWTLLGHEYVEMKNSHAAIEAYRRAVDVNRKDYRAWYGLGQAYELLNMHQYALHYFQQATALRAYDVRLWQAQAACYKDLGRPREAIECFKHALLYADPHETGVHIKIADLYKDLDEYAEASAYHRRVVEVCRADKKDVTHYARSACFVARYHLLQGGNDILLAKEYLALVAKSNAEEVGVAAELLKKVDEVLADRARAGATGVGMGPTTDASAHPGPRPPAREASIVV